MPIQTIFWSVDADDEYFWKRSPSILSVTSINKNRFKYILYSVNPLSNFQKRILAIIFNLTGISISVRILPQLDIQNPANWSRFCHPYQTQECCLYLDMDVLCQKIIDIPEINTNKIFALRENDIDNRVADSFKSAYNIELTSYYNSGVILFNKNSVTKNDLDKLFKIASLKDSYNNHPKLQYAIEKNEQDGMNVVFQDRIEELSRSILDCNKTNDRNNECQLIHLIREVWYYDTPYNLTWFNWKKQLENYVLCH
jgi:lipopolysaccharide biosynthesis glycosyltransferase